MEMTPEMIALGAELTAIAGRKSVAAIVDKIKMVKKKGDDNEIINSLEEIINELIADKNSLIQISQAYEEKLITQKITEAEIEYVTKSIIPLLEKLIASGDNKENEKMQESIDMIKSMLSKETLNILQILGFNFKTAIGEPLTELVASLIKSKIINESNATVGIQMLDQQREIEFFKVCQDEEAFNRLQSFYQK